MKRMTLIMAALVVVCSGCSRFTVRSSSEPGVNFQGLKTYAWKPGAQPSIGDPRVSDTVIDNAVRGAVDRELAAKGFTKAPADSADLLLAYYAGTDFDTSTVAITRSTNAGGGAFAPWQHVQSVSLEQGTVVLMVFDPQGKLIWRGMVTGLFDPTATPAKRQQRISDAIHELLESFPPR